MTLTTISSQTLLEAVSAHLQACDTTPDGLARPSAILWPDPERQWAALMPMLRERMPELIVLGEYEPEHRTGPAIWVRCVVDRMLEEVEIPEDRVPIVYMPDVARQELRAGDDCPDRLKPMIELMYRGTLWLQRGGHEWTVTAFLTSALGLDLARDEATRDALMRALRELAETPVTQLEGRRLEADDFDRLLLSDTVRDLLRWMGEPEVTKQRMGPERWAAFCSQCRSQYGLDPEADGEVTAGERLGLGEGPWAEVWRRFTEAPRSFPGVPELLRRAQPTSLAFDRSRWPHLNEEDETTVRAALEEVRSLTHHAACERVIELDTEHGQRRDWIWAELGLSPLAMVLKHLARLAQGARSALGGSTPDEIAQAYVDGAWEADAAAWEAVALASPAEERLLKNVVHALAGPWLDESARAFQHAAEAHGLPGREDQALVTAEGGTCLLFADGLRYDLARRLAERLEHRGCRVQVRHRWAALPTVTATAKPAVTPVAEAIAGETLPEDFAPNFNASGRKADAAGLRDALASAGYQVLGNDLGDWPTFDDARGWTESGALDKAGHDSQEDLCSRIGAELDRLAERIAGLLDGGWQTVRVVTDHGWLLLPQGLPKIELPRHLTASRWSRCAVVAGNSQVEAPVFPWHWNSAQRFATAPGAGAFNASQCYAHGGLSVQECLIPDLVIERSGEVRAAATIESITWRGMRCVIEAETGGSAVTADLRFGGPAGKSVVATTKALDDGGTTSLVVVDDAYEEKDLVLVLLDSSGTVLAQRTTKVGATS